MLGDLYRIYIFKYGDVPKAAFALYHVNLFSEDGSSVFPRSVGIHLRDYSVKPQKPQNEPSQVLAYKIPLTARYTGKVPEANMSLLSA
jgi:hypothetical protein